MRAWKPARQRPRRRRMAKKPIRPRSPRRPRRPFSFSRFITKKFDFFAPWRARFFNRQDLPVSAPCAAPQPQGFVGWNDMTDAIDQIFVTAKHWAVGLFPPFWQPLVSVLLTVAPLVAVFGLMFAISTVFERKGLGRIQNRYGPNRVGLPFTNLRLCGFGQFIADGIKALIKEDFVPQTADKAVHFLAPIA